ncbi:MAG: hypothetical protein KVP17_002289 [Porospora cf. gigantea B]|uniref:uncharacterized protein n=1 Tax=Porospora cf. gigantea B TaxID=2853592 RepID=UPI003571ED48|nr:MAG: hypothetical protein KVP17_002289 [Porospora cf. gigantea B]
MFGPNVSKVFSSQYLRYIGKNLLAPFEEEAIRERDFVIQADGLALEPSPLRLRLEKLLRSNFWEIIVDFFAIVNAACISVDLTYGNTELYHAKKYEVGQPYVMPHVHVVVNWAETIELAYLIGFWCEVTVCLGLFGSRYFVDMFSANDLLILVVSMLPYGVCGALHGFDSYDAKAWRRFTVARLLRVLRLVKLVRFDSLFRELWILVRGITYSFRVLFWGMGIGFLIIFIFSVPSTSFFGYNPSFQGMYDGWQMDLVGVDINEYTLYRFGTVSSSMRTLFQILTLDAWAELVDPLLVCSPGVWFFFVIFIFVACFAFLNLLTAIIVQSAINFSKDEEDRNEVETSNRRRLLQSGLERYTRKTVLTKREFIEILTSTSGFDRLLKSFGCATVDDVHSILDILADPYDPECRLSIQEFLLGAQRFKTGTAKSKDLMEALSRLSVLEYIARQQSMGLRNIKMKMKKIKKVLGGNMLVLQEQIMQLTTLVEYAIGEADAADELRRFPPLMASLSTIEEDDSTESRKVWESMETLESPTTQLPELRESVEDTTRILSPNPRRPPSYSSDHSPSTHRSLPGFYLSLGDPPTYVHRASGGVYSPSSLGHPPTYIHRASGGVYSSSTSSTPPDPPFAPR